MLITLQEHFYTSQQILICLGFVFSFVLGLFKRFLGVVVVGFCVCVCMCVCVCVCVCVFFLQGGGGGVRRD